MVNFSLDLKEADKAPESILDRYLEGSRAAELFSKTLKEFEAFTVEPDRENQPFLYMHTTAVTDGRAEIASYRSTAYFKIEIQDQIIDFINEIEKP